MEFDHLMQLIDKVSESKLTGFKYEDGELKLDMTRKEAKGQAASAAPEMTVETVKKTEGNIIASPLVGIFYTAPSEEAEPYVKAGDRVKKGQVLAIVEAMKLMNEIESEYDGVVAEVLAENGQTVEYGQPLFSIRETEV